MFQPFQPAQHLRRIVVSQASVNRTDVSVEPHDSTVGDMLSVLAHDGLQRTDGG